MKNRLATASALLCALLASGSAMASSTLWTGFQDITLGAIDLTPDDGIAATVGGNHASTLLFTRSHIGSSEQLHFAQVFDGDPGQLTLPIGSLTTQGVTGNLLAPGANLFFTAGDAGGSLGKDDRLIHEQEALLYVTVAPHTLLTLAGVYEQVDHLDPAAYGSQSTVNVMLGSNGSTASWNTSFDNTGTDDFLLGYANTTDTARFVAVTFRSITWLWGVEQISPVPEPASLPMLAGGLALLGYLTRRRATAATRLES